MGWTLVKGRDGLLRVILTEHCGSSVEVLLYGGQVVSWKNDRREELLFTSTKANMKAPKTIRGGIPICFPQFSNLGSLEQHGFARYKLWELDSCPSPLSPLKNQSSVDLVLKSTDEDLKTWPHRFELRLQITLSPDKLTLIPRVRNTDNKAFSFTFAMCNYLSVSDVSEVRVEGLETLDYFDNLRQKERFTEQADAVTFDGEVDRMYLSTPTKIAVIDHKKKRTIVLRKESLPDAGIRLANFTKPICYNARKCCCFAVLWNPWDKLAKALPDFGDEDYKAMLCLGSAIAEKPIILMPSEEWRGFQELSIVSSSYYSGQLDPCKALFG